MATPKIRDPGPVDMSAEAGKRAFARAHAPYKCGLCPEMVKVGTYHRHFDEDGTFHGNGNKLERLTNGQKVLAPRKAHVQQDAEGRAHPP